MDRNGVLLYKDRYFVNKESALIPKILFEDHNSLMEGHGGVYKTKKRIFKHFFWQNMGVDLAIKEYVKKCVHAIKMIK